MKFVTLSSLFSYHSTMLPDPCGLFIEDFQGCIRVGNQRQVNGGQQRTEEQCWLTGLQH